MLYPIVIVDLIKICGLFGYLEDNQVKSQINKFT